MEQTCTTAKSTIILVNDLPCFVENMPSLVEKLCSVIESLHSPMQINRDDNYQCHEQHQQDGKYDQHNQQNLQMVNR